MSSEKNGKVNDHSRVIQSNDSSFVVSPAFIFSIIGTIVGVGILVFLIFMIPNCPGNAPTSYADTAFDNYFYDVQYRYSSSSTSRDPIANPNPIYFILMPFAMIAIAFSGIGIFVKNRKEVRRLIFINWALYLVPIGMAIAKDVYNKNGYWFNIAQPLGFFPLYLCIFLQFSLLLDKNSFLDWAGFSEKSKNDNVRFHLNYRRVIAVIFIMIFIYTFSIPLLGAFTLSNNYSLFAHVWTALPLLICWYLFGELIRFQISNRRPHGKVMEYVVVNYIGKSELSLLVIADYANISVDNVRKALLKEIRNGHILGEISENGTVLFLLEPSVYFKRKEKPIEEVEPRVIKEFETQPWFFWISVVLSVIAVGTLTVAICFIPILETRINGNVAGTFNNFFYKWSYYYVYYSDYTRLSWIKPHIGGSILLSISVLFQTISGLGFLVRNRKDSKKLNYINWLLYCVPIIAGVVISAIGLFTLSRTQYNALDGLGMPLILSFYYLTPFVFMQGSMFVLDNTFSEWSSFKGEKAQKERPIRTGRMVSAIFFFLIFAWMWFYPFGLMIFPFSTESLHITHTSLYFAMLVWWLFGDLVGIIALKGKWKKMIERTIKMGVFDLESISMRYNIPLDVTLEVAHILTSKGIIIGDLDEKNKLIMPKQREGAFVCVSCSKPNEKDAKFCSHCGSKLDFAKLLQEVKNRTSSKSTLDPELLPITKNKIMGIFSTAFFAISTVGYIVLMNFGFDYFFATIPFALFLIAGTILGAKASYHAVGKAGYSLNTISLIVLIIYIFTMLMWTL
ncbi:MAG: zinc ribbon domain-containing protein [Candidatus Heimdallarchaeota archaeon]|nr:zinc ribbon domain-containing protein [Candidatus Heimdallarchaeota archaeon]MBY8994861.1 zinc ribbon domain-containing protein [Candidatus Heimdallarchaeota archaeon]